MQIKKAEVRENIIEAARHEFLKNGFSGTSLRSIVKSAGCSLSNFYNYFDTKERLFEAVVMPAVEQIKVIFEGMKKISLPNGMLMQSYDAEKEKLGYIFNFVQDNKESLWLVVHGSEGSHIAGYKDFAVETITDIWMDYITHIKSISGVEISRFFIKNACSFYVNAVVELLKYEASREEMKKWGEEILDFTYYGFKRLIENQKKGE